MSPKGHSAEIRQRDERLILIQLVLQMNLLLARALRPRNSAPLDTIHVAQAVYEGHMMDRPMTAHKIAQYLEMPRATVQDRLKFLLKRNVVRQDGRLFFIGSRYLQTTAIDIDHLKALVFDATEKLNEIEQRSARSRLRERKA